MLHHYNSSIRTTRNSIYEFEFIHRINLFYNKFLMRILFKINKKKKKKKILNDLQSWNFNNLIAT